MERCTFTIYELRDTLVATRRFMFLTYLLAAALGRGNLLCLK